jgi:hypothetical protein
VVTRRVRLVGCASVLSVAVLVGCGHTFVPPAALVGGRPISQATLSETVREFLTDPATAQQVAAGGEAARSDFTRRVLRYLIEVELARGYARVHGIRVSAASVQSELARDEQQQGGPEAFARFLRARGLTVAEVKLNVERILLLTDLAGALSPNAASPGAGQDALQAWLTRQSRTVEVRINPRFGTFDLHSTEIEPIDSTAMLPE